MHVSTGIILTISILFSASAALIAGESSQTGMTDSSKPFYPIIKENATEEEIIREYVHFIKSSIESMSTSGKGFANVETTPIQFGLAPGFQIFDSIGNVCGLSVLGVAQGQKGVYGISAAPLSCTLENYGISASLTDVKTSGGGVSVGALVNSVIGGSNYGMMVSLLNIQISDDKQDSVCGVQAGAVNISNESEYGFQIGVINSANSGKMFQIGLININPESWLFATPFLNFTW